MIKFITNRFQFQNKLNIKDDDTNSESLTNSPEKLFEDTQLLEEETKFILDELTDDDMDFNKIFEPIIDYPDEEIVKKLIIEAVLDDIIDGVIEYKTNNITSTKINIYSVNLFFVAISFSLFMYMYFQC